MKSAVIVFPGSNCDRDLAEALRLTSGRTPAACAAPSSHSPQVTMAAAGTPSRSEGKKRLP